MDEEARKEFLDEMRYEGMIEQAMIAFEEEQKQMAESAYWDEQLDALDLEDGEIDEC